MKRSSGWRLAGILLILVLLSACSAGGGSTTATVPSAEQPTGVQDAATTAPEATAPVDATATMAQVTETSPADTSAATETVEQPIDEPTATTGSVPGDSVGAFPDPAGFAWQPVIEGMARPLDLLSPPGDLERIFVVEQPGVIRILQAGALLETPFLDISDRVKRDGNEQGLLGLAFHPQYAENGYFYVNYTSFVGVGDTVIARYSVSASDPNRGDPNSEVVLLTVSQPYANHNGGGMVFGPEGYLYMSLGDGGSAGDPQGNGQSLNTHLGKILRIDVDGGEPYAIPSDNPFAGGGGMSEIWAYGLRNPWRFSFDRATGDLYIADVGQNAWEEINFQPAGVPGGWNYGWDYLEGTHPFEGQPDPSLELVDPIFEYQHGVGCSVTGGYVYRGELLPEFRGIYLFSDYCTGRVWGLLRGADGSWQNKELFQTGWNVSSFGQDAQGELYIIDQGSGTIYQLVRQ